MKYHLKQTNTGCVCKKSKSYVLVEDLEGYDLIQVKRGFQENFSGLVLKPGEPAFVFDTGKFYIGGINGVPILINGGSGGSSVGSPLAVRGTFEDKTLIEVPYINMITADGSVPTGEDIGVYLTILVIDEDKMPVGQGYLTNWNFTKSSAQFAYRKFHDGNVNQLIFKQDTPVSMWTVESQLWDTSKIVNLEVWDNNGNPIMVAYDIIDEHTVTISFFNPTAGEAVFHYRAD